MRRFLRVILFPFVAFAVLLGWVLIVIGERKESKTMILGLAMWATKDEVKR